MSIAERLLSARLKAGLSQADLADKVGVSQQSIQKLNQARQHFLAELKILHTQSVSLLTGYSLVHQMKTVLKQTLKSKNGKILGIITMILLVSLCWT